MQSMSTTCDKPYHMISSSVHCVLQCTDDGKQQDLARPTILTVAMDCNLGKPSFSIRFAAQILSKSAIA